MCLIYYVNHVTVVCVVSHLIYNTGPQSLGGDPFRHLLATGFNVLSLPSLTEVHTSHFEKRLTYRENIMNVAGMGGGGGLLGRGGGGGCRVVLEGGRNGKVSGLWQLHMSETRDDRVTSYIP